jgi:hypothetical protein
MTLSLFIIHNEQTKKWYPIFTFQNNYSHNAWRN